MKTSLLLLFVIIVASLPPAPAAQSPAGGVEHFSKDGLSFDYPAGWTLEDKSSEQVQHIIIKRAGNSVLVMVVAQREPARTVAQMLDSRNAITMPYVANLARQLGETDVPTSNDAQCKQVGARLATGFRLKGHLELDMAAGEVYSVVLGQRLVHLIYVRADKEEEQGAPVWKTVSDTLKVAPPANPSPEAAQMEQVVIGGVLKGQALSKPQPSYPSSAREQRAQGPVTVKIVVNESGNVISAQAISGNPALHEAGEAAARRAKFSPTYLCGKPVKVSGVITYNFVLR
ncbi:MAG: periplasmic protein TonB [Acidobacteriota bacterium]|nr:periplasmic protein TonB [Acidobacteriota bacterium]